MTHLNYLLAGWGLCLGSGLLYAIHLIRKGRALASRVPADRRSWLSSEDAR